MDERMRDLHAGHHQRADRSLDSAGMQSVAAPSMPNDRPSFRDGRTERSLQAPLGSMHMRLPSSGGGVSAARAFARHFATV